MIQKVKKKKKFAKKEIDARVPRGTLGASPNSLREATDFAERKDCSQPTVNANRLVLFLTFLPSTIKNIRCAKNLGGEEDSSQMQWK